MPGNLTQSPWKSTRDRQDFEEVLYLNITSWGNSQAPINAGQGLFRITLNTSAGYFELPNYMNGGIPGPLLAKDPNSICGNACESEGQDIM